MYITFRELYQAQYFQCNKAKAGTLLVVVDLKSAKRPTEKGGQQRRLDTIFAGCDLAVHVCMIPYGHI